MKKLQQKWKLMKKSQGRPIRRSSIAVHKRLFHQNCDGNQATYSFPPQKIYPYIFNKHCLTLRKQCDKYQTEKQLKQPNIYHSGLVRLIQYSNNNCPAAFQTPLYQFSPAAISRHLKCILSNSPNIAETGRSGGMSSSYYHWNVSGQQQNSLHGFRHSQHQKSKLNQKANLVSCKTDVVPDRFHVAKCSGSVQVWQNLTSRD